jgi:hypothetical protein
MTPKRLEKNSIGHSDINLCQNYSIFIDVNFTNSGIFAVVEIQFL